MIRLVLTSIVSMIAAGYLACAIDMSDIRIRHNDMIVDSVEAPTAFGHEPTVE